MLPGSPGDQVTWIPVVATGPLPLVTCATARSEIGAGAASSMVSPASGPGAAGIGVFEQSRDLIETTLIAPVPSPENTERRSTVKSSPPVVTPHGLP